ncbi:MAG: PIN domain-containing protein [Synergistaceae bacterium]|nr:PIN domain-containing protein [Synergistaceae bacterium]MBR0078805.1 PIN domain-containing protein [Synergistaceae bacterium]
MFDTNMILRYLLDDNLEMADKAEEYIKNENADVFVTVEVIAEVVYVLQKVYSLERKQISDLVCNFVELVNCDEHDSVVLALALFGANKIDFVDCVLYAYNKLYGVEIATFDKQLLKLLS